MSERDKVLLLEQGLHWLREMDREFGMVSISLSTGGSEPQIHLFHAPDFVKIPGEFSAEVVLSCNCKIFLRKKFGGFGFVYVMSAEEQQAAFPSSDFLDLEKISKVLAGVKNG